MKLDDRSGSVEALLFATQYERLVPMIEEDKAVLLRGLGLPEENAPPKISVQEVVPLEVARVPLPSLISIKVRLGKNGGTEPATELQKLFQEKPGETEVRFRLELPRDFSVILDVTVKVRPYLEFKEALEKICGADAIEVLAS